MKATFNERVMRKLAATLDARWLPVCREALERRDLDGYEEKGMFIVRTLSANPETRFAALKIERAFIDAYTKSAAS